MADAAFLFNQCASGERIWAVWEWEYGQSHVDVCICPDRYALPTDRSRVSKVKPHKRFSAHCWIFKGKMGELHALSKSPTHVHPSTYTGNKSWIALCLPWGKKVRWLCFLSRCQICSNTSNQSLVFHVTMSLKSLMAYSRGKKKMERWSLFEVKVQRRGTAYPHWNVVLHSCYEFYCI